MLKVSFTTKRKKDNINKLRVLIYNFKDKSAASMTFYYDENDIVDTLEIKKAIIEALEKLEIKKEKKNENKIF